jgi:hypothetical protein
MKNSRLKFLALLTGLAFLAVAPLSMSQSGPKKSTTQIKLLGTTSLKGHAPPATGEVGTEFRVEPDVDVRFNKQITGAISPARVPSAHVPTPQGSAFTALDANFFGFNGLTHRDQRLADGGNQFSLEPPDQGLAVGNGFVLESVNTALAVYNTSGTRLAGPTALNPFFGLPSAIVRGTPNVFGPFVTDPKSYFDAGTQRFFLTALEIDVDPATGAFLPGSHVLIAVSATPDPTGSWNVFSIDVTNDGGQFGACPCFGDQPLIGADANGFYINTNAFTINPFGLFRGTQIYAMSKSALAAGTTPTVVHINNLTQGEGPAFSIQPAIVPPGGTFETASGGTEYFVSSLDFNGTLDNRLSVWALTNSSTLNSTPDVTLTNLVITVQDYGQSPDAQQRDGPIPLGASLKQHLELVASNDDRQQQVVFAAGHLWTALNSVVKTPNGPARTGIAWFILTPSVSGTAVSASVANQGYVSVNSPSQQSVMFPSIGVNTSGQGVLAFTVVGQSFFPSAAYAPINAADGVGAIRIAAAGAGPDDGFSGYPPFSGSRTGRWGDYSAAVADETGNIWFGVEYIPNLPRTVNANWGTFIGKVTP